MPKGSDLNDHLLLRTMLLGAGKTKKTWWACRFAEFGFNVLLLDGDDGAHIIKQLPKDAQNRIDVLGLTTKEDNQVFCRFLAGFLKPKNDFWWDENKRTFALGLKDKTHSHYEIDAAKLSSNDVVILDSWTALVESAHMQYLKENKIDPGEFEEVSDGFGGLKYESNFLNWILARLHALPCHVIVICHSKVYEKWDRRDKKNPKLVEQIVIPTSSSGPHGKLLIKHFSDVLYFTRLGSESIRIDTSGDKDRDGGSRLIAPQNADWKALSPEILIKAIGMKPTGNPNLGAIYHPAGDVTSIAGPSLTVVSDKQAEKSETKVIGSGLSLMEKIRMSKGGAV